MATKPTDLEEQNPLEELPYAYCIAIFEADRNYRTEVEMADDEAGTGAFTCGYAEGGQEVFVYFGNNVYAGSPAKWFRIRHIHAKETASPWTPRIQVSARRYGSARRPDPVLPTVQEQPSVTSGTTGTLTLNVIDPQKRVTLVEFQSQSGHDAASAWTTDGSVPYSLSVALLHNLGSRINYRITGYDADAVLQYIADGSVPFPARPAVASGTLRKVSDSTTQETVRLTVTLGTNGATPLQYKYRQSTIGSVPAYSAWANVGTGASGQTVDIVCTRPARFPMALDVVIRDGSLTEVELPTYVSMSTQEFLASDGYLDPDKKYSGMNIMTPRAASSQGHGIFLDSFEDLPSSWHNRGNDVSLVESIQTTGLAGGRAYRAQRQAWRSHPFNYAFDPSKLYRMRARVRLVTAPTDASKDIIYIGLECVGADGVTLVNDSGANSASAQHYLCAYGADLGGYTLGDWVEFTGYFKGHGTTIAENLTVASNILTPARLHPNVRYFRPMFVVNYAAGDGVTELDYIAIDVMDEELAESTARSITGLNQLQSTVKFAESTGMLLTLLRGVQWGWCRDGVPVTFPTAYDVGAEPIVIILPVGDFISYEGDSTLWDVSGGGAYSATKEQRHVIDPEDVTETGFTPYMKLHQKQTYTYTDRSHNFSSLEDLDVDTEETAYITLSNAPAYDNYYEFHVNVQLDADTDTSKFTLGGSFELDIDIMIDKTGDGVFEYYTRETLVIDNDDDPLNYDATITFPITLSGLTSSARAKVRLNDIRDNCNGVITNLRVRGHWGATYNGVDYTTAAGTPDIKRSMTPDSNHCMMWLAMRGTNG